MKMTATYKAYYKSSYTLRKMLELGYGIKVRFTTTVAIWVLKEKLAF